MWEKFANDTAAVKGMDGFNEFILSKYGSEMINECSGSAFDWISAEGKIIVKFVGRFERLQQDWKLICRSIGAKKAELPWLNKVERRPYQEYYVPETRELIAKRFSRTIEEFDYRF